MARRSEHSQDEIKTMILNAAEAIVIENGCGELKVRSIAMEIGYTVGTIYMVFDSLADLILHLKARTLDDLNMQFQKAPLAGSPDKCLLNLAMAYFNFAKHHFHRWQMVFDNTTPNDIPLPDWYFIKFEHLYSAIENQFRLLSTTQASAEYLRLSAQAFLGGIHGICSLFIPLYRSIDKQSSDRIEATVTLLVENFVQGWLINMPVIRQSL